MKRLIPLLFACLLITSTAHAFDVPKHTGWVNDYAQIIPSKTRAKLTSMLTIFNDEASAQIAVLTIPSLKGQKLEDYSLAVANSWALGQKDKNNGVLLLVARKERMIRIEVGMGLTGILTSKAASLVIKNSIKPNFLYGDFGGGLLNGVQHIIAIIRDGYSPDSAER